MRQAISAIILSALNEARSGDLLTYKELPSIIVERSKKIEFGDFATNIAMLLAPIEKRAPRDIAKVIADIITTDIQVDKCEVAGPGFINIFLKKSYWADSLLLLLQPGSDNTYSQGVKSKKIQVEFVSANPTGPLHIGHGRGAAVGDALARILSAVGHDVTREYYINDVGNQMDTLARSVHLRYNQLITGHEADFPDNYYRGDYIKDIAQELLDRDGEKFKDAKEEGFVPVFKTYASTRILDGIKADLADFGVEFDIWKSEGSLFETGLVDETITLLKEKGHLYDKDGALWFRTTDFGDDKDRVLIKANGALTYFASDVAYHREKINRGFETIVDIWGADHHGYLKRVKAIFEALEIEGVSAEALEVIFIQLVSLQRDGLPVVMSTRAGKFVTLREVMDEVGTDACRFFFLMRRPDAQLDFDLELAKKHAPENPVFYVQYCHARICSILKHAQEQGITLPEKAPDAKIIALLNAPDDIEIIKHLASFPEVLRASAVHMEPHRINYFLQQLAGLFHPYYNRHRIVTENKTETLARLYLCTAIKTITKKGLYLLGVSAPTEM